MARVAQLSKGNGKAIGGNSGRNAKAGKKGTGASRKKRKKQQVQAMSQGDDTGYVARVDEDGGAASDEENRRVSATYSRIFGLQAIVALCFFFLASFCAQSQSLWEL